MSHSRRRVTLALAAVLTVTSGTYSFAQIVEEETPAPVLKCWAEVCDARMCVKEEIKCPVPLVPIE